MADGLGTAGTVLSTAAPLLNAVPVVGSLLSMGATIGGGLMQNAAAKKQAEQAARTREQAAGIKPRDIQSEYYKKLRADQMASLSGLAGLELGQQKLDAATAANLRNIREGSASGAQTVAALSSALGQQNMAQNALTAQDLEYRADMRQQVGNDLAMVGERKDVQQGITDQKQRDMLQMAAALENASTFNKQQGTNQILGAVSSTASSLGNMPIEQSQRKQQEAYMKWLMQNGVTPATADATATNPYSSIANNPYASKTNSMGFWQQ